MRVRKILAGLILASLPFTVLVAGANPCRPGDYSCTPRPCKVNVRVDSDGTITVGSPLIDCYY